MCKVISGRDKFKDPWLIDYPDPDYGNDKRNRGMKSSGPDALIFKKRPSPFSPDYTTSYDGDVYQGVFLNQPYTGDNPVYYSVGLPAMQTIPFHGQDIKWHFQGWEGTDVQFHNAGASQTPIVFLNGDAEARATGYPNKRSLTYQETVQANWLHLIYVDGGGIWYSRYSSENSVWIAEELVCGPATVDNSNINPALAVAEVNGQTRVYVVWEKIENGLHKIAFRQKSGNTWGSISTISGSNVGTTEARPVIEALSNGTLYVAWRAKKSGDNYQRVYVRYRSSNGSWGNTGSAPTTVDNFPSMVYATYQYASPLKLVWASGAIIKSIGAKYASGSWSWSAVSNVSSLPVMAISYDPQVSLEANRYGRIAWEGYNIDLEREEALYVKYDFQNNSKVGNEYVIDYQTGSGMVPQISLDTRDNYVRVVYEKSGQIWRAQQGSGSWTKSAWSSGKYPLLAQYGGANVVWVKESSQPYLLHTEIAGSFFAKSAGVDEAIIAKRFYYPLLESASERTGYYYVDVEELSIDEKVYGLNDTLQTEALTLSGESRIQVTLEADTSEVKSNAILLYFYFVSPEGRFLLDKIDYAALQGGGSLLHSMTLNSKKPLHGYIEITFDEVEPCVVNVLKGQEERALLAKSAADEEGVTLRMPETFRLWQNFPNPFGESHPLGVIR